MNPNEALSLGSISKIVMPALFAILLFLVGYNLFRSNFAEAFAFLFTPDFWRS